MDSPSSLKDPVAILIVDDEEILQTTIKNCISRFAGVPQERIYLASSGEEGLELLSKQDDIGVVCSDHDIFRSMNGGKFLSIVKERYTKDYRMLLTGNPDRYDEFVNSELCHGCYKKPFDIKLFVEGIKKGIEWHLSQG